MMHVATQQLHGRDTDRALDHVRVCRDAWVRHHRLNPQDGVENCSILSNDGIFGKIGVVHAGLWERVLLLVVSHQHQVASQSAMVSIPANLGCATARL